MIDEISTVTSTAVSVALDALAQRQRLIAANIANLNGKDAVARELDFESAFKRAVESAADTGRSREQLEQLRRDLEAGTLTKNSSTTPTKADAELIRLNETVIRYQALIQGLGKYGSLTRMAIVGEIKS